MEKETLKEENIRLKTALMLIHILKNKEEAHLGHPRISDLNCISCIAYLSANYGAYAYLTQKMLDKKLEELNNK